MIHIISDSSTMYSIESAKKKGLSIVPLNISVDSQTYRDFEDITSTQLLTMIEEFLKLHSQVLEKRLIYIINFLRMVMK